MSHVDYLDRESLAALIEALKVFEGGVLVITHNRDFSESLCHEVWAMRDGHLEASGHNWVEGQGSGARIDKKDGEEEDQYDAMGNKIDNKKAKKLTSAEQRKVRFLYSVRSKFWLTNHCVHSSRRSAWLAGREVKMSATMSSKVIFPGVVDMFLYGLHHVFAFPTFVLCCYYPRSVSVPCSLLSYNGFLDFMSLPSRMNAMYLCSDTRFIWIHCENKKKLSANDQIIVLHCARALRTFDPVSAQTCARRFGIQLELELYSSRCVPRPQPLFLYLRPTLRCPTLMTETSFCTLEMSAHNSLQTLLREQL
jgi:hypothetical protein